jgi:hypothetical protein
MDVCCYILYSKIYIKYLLYRVAKPNKESPSPLPHSRMKHLDFIIFDKQEPPEGDSNPWTHLDSSNEEQGSVACPEPQLVLP